MEIDNKLIISFLSGFVTKQRYSRLEETLTQRTRYVTVLLEDIYQSQNASAVLRTCECFGVQDVHVVENYNQYNINPMVVKGSDQWLSINKYNASDHNSVETVNLLKSRGYRIVATSLCDESVDLHDFDLSAGKCAIVFGNEHQGVSKEILEEADVHLKIPMCGFTQSLNISVSAGIVLSGLMHRLKRSNIKWELTEAEKEILRVEWLKCSVKNSRLLIERFIEEHKK